MDYIATLQAEIDACRRQEETSRIQREALERLLKKFLQETAIQVVIDNKQTTSNNNQKPEYKSKDAQEMSSVLISVMSDGNNWRMTDLLAAVGERLGRRVPNSTLRYVISREQASITKVGPGLFRLNRNILDETQSG
jgi:aryl-alcohol dehydrogenase-like predicted oxidoreductase